MSVENLSLGPRPDPLRVLAEFLPRPFRFLAVGAIGLTTDICIFTILVAYAPMLVVVGLVWRLEHAEQPNEAPTVVTQGHS